MRSSGGAFIAQRSYPCEVETNLVDLLVPARVLHEQGDLDAVVDV
jgi:hypothetical protein